MTETADAGQLWLRMTIQVDEKRADSVLFHAFTKKGVDKQVIGGMKAVLGRAMGSGFKDGSLIRIVNGVIHQDSMTGVLASPFGNFYIRAAVRNGNLTGVLEDGVHAVVGMLHGTMDSHALPLRDYPAILDSALGIAAHKIYDPALLKSKAWIEFNEEMRRIARLAEDDATFVMAFFYYARKLPFSHFTLHIPAALPEGKSIPTEPAGLTIEDRPNRTAYVRIPSFAGSAQPIDDLFESLMTKPYDNLIVDLRDNPGGTVEAGMAFARHLLRDTVYCGVFLTQQYFRQHATVPGPQDFHSFPHFSEASYDLLMQGISEYPAICLKAYPTAPHFGGRVYVLCNENTASTCEPIIYALKQHHLATIVGAKTAGAMLSSESFPIQDGYRLGVPTATYYTADGFKIDQRGVTPDIAVKGADALNYVLNSISSTQHD